jgi:hypothetical protein
VNADRETVRKILTEDLDIRKACAKWSQRSSLKNKGKVESQFAKTFWRGKMTFWPVSSQVMKQGATDTTLKQSRKVYNGRLPITLDQIFHQSKPRVKTMLLNFDIREIVHYKFVPTGHSTKFSIWKYWKGYLKKTEMTCTFVNGSWILHHDNAPAHTALSVREILATKQITVGAPCLFTGSVFVPEDKGNIERKAF